MMHLRGLVLFLFVLLGGARRSIRIDDSHHDAQQQHTRANGLGASAVAREALIPVGLRTQVSRLAGPHAVALREGLRSGPRRGKVVLRAVVDDKAVVKDYFDNEGFNRWSRIYSEDGDVNTVQKDIRTGHAQTVEKVLAWVDADGTAKAGETFCDAGCGVGSLALPLAARGAKVWASDISTSMVQEAEKRAAAVGLSDRITFAALDLELVDGEFDTVTCLDVLIHYPQDKMANMVQGLAKKAKRRVIISFAPDTWYYRALKSFGELFPGPSKATRAYLHTEDAVVAALELAGFKITRTEMTGTSFYFSRLLEAERV